MRKIPVEIMTCPYGHGAICIAINDYRAFGGKCCGSWKTLKLWEVGYGDLLKTLSAALGKRIVTKQPRKRI